MADQEEFGFQDFDREDDYPDYDLDISDEPSSEEIRDAFSEDPAFYNGLSSEELSAFGENSQQMSTNINSYVKVYEIRKDKTTPTGNYGLQIIIGDFLFGDVRITEDKCTLENYSIIRAVNVAREISSHLGIEARLYEGNDYVDLRTNQLRFRDPTSTQ